VSSALANSNPILSQHFERNHLLSQLIWLERDYLLPRLQVMDLSVNETVYNEGDATEFVYFPIDCVISSLALLRDGSTVEIAMMGREAIVGSGAILGANINRYWMRMSLAGRLVKLHTDDLTAVFNRNKSIAKAILHSFNLLVTQISQRSVCHARHSVMERFSCWLLMIDDRLGEGSFKLTQELIASRLGARRAGITVAARMLSEINGVEYKRGSLQIKDRAVVEQQSCECYSVLKLKAEQAQRPVFEYQSPRRVVPPLTPPSDFLVRRSDGAS